MSYIVKLYLPIGGGVEPSMVISCNDYKEACIVADELFKHHLPKDVSERALELVQFNTSRRKEGSTTFITEEGLLTCEVKKV